MRVVYHHRTQGRGAEGVHVSGIVNAFRELGHEVRVVCPPGVGQEGAAADRAAPGGNRTVGKVLSSTWKRVSRWSPELLFELLELVYNYWSYLTLRRAVREFRPDLIYDRYSLFHVAPSWLSQRSGIPLVTEVNDSTVIRRTRPLSLKRLARRLEGRILGRSTLVVTVSERFRELILASHDLPAESIVITPNAVDPARFARQGTSDRRASLGLENQVVLGVVGGFVPWHGLDHLVLSVEQLFNERDDLHVLLIGDGPVRGEVEALVKRLGLERRVEFTGFVPAADVSGYIECMDVCLMPDSNEHGSPIKIFEYMAMGKAVAAARYGPIEEVIEHGRTGVLFRPHDRAELRDAVRSLVEDPELRSRIGRAARAHVLARHTWSANVLKVLEGLDRRPGRAARARSVGP